MSACPASKRAERLPCVDLRNALMAMEDRWMMDRRGVRERTCTKPLAMAALSELAELVALVALHLPMRKDFVDPILAAFDACGVREKRVGGAK